MKKIAIVHESSFKIAFKMDISIITMPSESSFAADGIFRIIGFRVVKFAGDRDKLMIIVIAKKFFKSINI